MSTYHFNISEPGTIGYGDLHWVTVTLDRGSAPIEERNLLAALPFLRLRIQWAKRRMLKRALMLARQRTDVLITPRGAVHTQREQETE